MTMPDFHLTVRSLASDELDRFHSVGEPESDIRKNLRALWRDGLSRPAWTFFVERDGAPVGLAAFWTFPDTPHDMSLTTLELPWPDDPLAVGRVLLAESLARLKAGGATSVDCKLYDSETFLDRRHAVVRASGFELVQEKVRFEAPASSPPASTRLSFRSRDEVGDDAFRDAIRRVTAGTLDGKDRATVARIGPQAAAAEYFDVLRSMDDEGERWRLAFDAEGRLAGLIVAQQLRKDLGAVNYIGVVPEFRGRGYVDILLAEGMRLLAPLGLEKVVADTDALNAPMAGAFRRAGYRQVERLWVYAMRLTGGD